MKITIGTDFENNKEEDQARYIGVFADQVKNAVNGNLTFSDNVRCAIREVAFTAANVDVQVNHGLNNIPTGYIQSSASAAMSIYDGSAASDKTYIYLRSNAVGSSKVLIF